MVGIHDAGLRLLSLDGGGVYGLSELFILRGLMERIKLKEQLDHEPCPCDYFDLIGGTGVGGLIALMLGCLRMSIPQAIEHYSLFAEQVFSKGKKNFGDGKFKASVFENAVKQLVEKTTNYADLRLIDNRWNHGGCNTFVCARMAGGTPVLFRTYLAPENQSPNCKIWEAARATSATPMIFKHIRIIDAGFGLSYIDGGPGYNNPTGKVEEEAELLFPGRTIACIINIGTGLPPVLRIPKANLWQKRVLTDVSRALQDGANDCEAMSGAMEKRYRNQPGTYFRFNVMERLQGVGLADWHQIEQVEVQTVDYLKDVDEKISFAVEVLLGGRG